MELYLDSVDFKEIEEAQKLGFLTGLTTTPTFMHRHGITDIDAAIVKLSKMVSWLHVEALGDTPEEIVKEADRLIALGLNPETTFFKVPVSLIGVTACKMLKDKGYRVNVHLCYTLNQAYMAMSAGADYVCVLVGRFQDQGHDALTLVEECIDMIERFGSESKVMFSSVRHAEHVRTAIRAGAHCCTVPWSVMKNLTTNNFTTVGTDQFIEHTKLMTMRVKEVVKSENPTVSESDTILDALVKMTDSKLGAVSVLDSAGNLKGVFTDGDIRRQLKESGKSTMDKKMGDFTYKAPITVSADALLYDAVNIFKKDKIDNILVLDNNKPAGILDIQDLVEMGLIG
jgi:transaldolase